MTINKKELNAALISAAKEGHDDVARLLVSRGAKVNCTGGARGMTPLLEAAKGGHVDAMKVLIEHGADPDAQSIGGFRPMHAAAYFGHTDTVRRLIDSGADPQATDEYGQTAFRAFFT